MTSNNQINNKKLSDKERAQLKKVMFFGALGVIFLLAMWFIFKPSQTQKEEDETGIGLNQAIPQAADDALIDDKQNAYKAQIYEEKEQERQAGINNLSDHFVLQTEAADTQLIENQNENNEINQSVAHYQSAQRELTSFYGEPSYDEEKKEMQDEIDTLKEALYELQELQESNNTVDEQMKLMEKSYEMAARYLPQTSNTGASPFTTAIERPMEEKEVTHSKSTNLPLLTVAADDKSVVSSLYREISDSLFIDQQFQERNRAFYTATETSDDIPDKNTLRVTVHETVTLGVGETVRLRLMETARIATMIIPKNSLLTATARLQGNRMFLSVSSIEHRERIVGVKLSAYELDGQEGLFIPGSAEISAVKEIAAGMGQSTGTSFTFTSSAGQQLAADAGKSILQGASKYFGNKMREVKITLKAGHQLYLVQQK